MRTRQGILIGVASSLFTLIAVFTLLIASGAALAQKGEPPKPSLSANDQNVADRAAPPSPGDQNAGAPASPAAPGEDSPDAGPGYVHFPGSVFIPMHSASSVEYAPWGCMYMTGPENSSNYAIELPSGSTITFLRLYYYDTSASNGTMQFAQYDDGAGGTYLETLQTTGNSGMGTDTHSGLNYTLDYVNFSYVLYWEGGVTNNTIQLCGFRIGYTPPLGMVGLIPSTLYNAHP